MESSISRFYGSLSSFLSHVESTSEALADSIRRRPIPLDSATASFTQRVGQKVSAASSDLELLEEMAMGTVSVAELVGHMSEVYKRNEEHLDILQDRLSSLGYIPEVDSDEDLPAESLSPNSARQPSIHTSGSNFERKSSSKLLDEDLLLEDSISLQDFGLSAASLATLASEDKYDLSSTLHEENLSSSVYGKKINKDASHHSCVESTGQGDAFTVRNLLEVSRTEYDQIPAYLKNLASWEVLQEAVAKINIGITNKGISKSCSSFGEADIEELGLGGW